MAIKKNNETQYDEQGRFIHACCGIAAIMPAEDECADVFAYMNELIKENGSILAALLADGMERCDIINRDEDGYFYGEHRGDVPEYKLWNNVLSIMFWEDHIGEVNKIVNDFIANNRGATAKVISVYSYARNLILDREVKAAGITGVHFDLTVPTVNAYENAIGILGDMGEDITNMVEYGVSRMQEAYASPDLIAQFINNIYGDFMQVIDKYLTTIESDMPKNQQQAPTQNQIVADKYYQYMMQELNKNTQLWAQQGYTQEQIKQSYDASVENFNKVAAGLAEGRLIVGEDGCIHDAPQVGHAARVAADENKMVLNPAIEVMRRRSAAASKGFDTSAGLAAAYTNSEATVNANIPNSDFTNLVAKRTDVFADFGAMDLTPIDGSSAPSHHPNDPMYNGGLTYNPYPSAAANNVYTSMPVTRPEGDSLGGCPIGDIPKPTDSNF